MAIVTVQGAGAKLLVHPTTSIHFVLHRLASVTGGGPHRWIKADNELALAYVGYGQLHKQQNQIA